MKDCAFCRCQLTLCWRAAAPLHYWWRLGPDWPTRGQVGDVSLPHLRKTTITSFGGLLSFTLYWVRLDFTLTAGVSWSQLSSGAAAAGYWGESCWNTHSIQRHSEYSGMLLRPFQNIIISNLLLVGCRTGSLALGRPSITVLLGQAWRVYGSAKPLVCKSLLVLVCEILKQGCCFFFLCLSLLDVLRKGCVSNSWTHAISNPRSDTMWPDFFLSQFAT